MSIQLITPFLWFDNQAEEAARFYVSVFPDSKIVKTVRCGQAGPGPAGSVLTIEFELHGQKFVGAERRPSFQIHRGRLVRGELRNAGRSGRLLGQADRRRLGSAMRLAQGQVRPLVADRARGVPAIAERSRSEEGGPRHASHDVDEKARRPRTRGGRRGELSRAAYCALEQARLLDRHSICIRAPQSSNLFEDMREVEGLLRDAARCVVD